MDTNRFLAGLSAIFASGQKEQVGQYLRESLAEAEAEGDDQAAVTVLNEMIGYFRITSAHAESLRAAGRALELMRRLGQENSLPYATTLLNAATAHKAAGQNARARELFQAALVIYLRELPAGRPDERLAALYNNLSALHQDAGEYGQAAEYLGKAASILSQIKGAELDAATVHTNLALALFEMGREAEALETLRKALGIFQSAAPNGRVDPKAAPHYASTLAGLATACYRMKDYARAAELFEEALGRIKEAYGENDDYLLTCRNCAAAYAAAGNPAKALAYRMLAEAAGGTGKRTVTTGADMNEISAPGKPARGLELARAYYEACGREMIRSRFPAYEQRIAAGLVGEGSECFGFDDEISRDHDFGPSFCLWLTPEDYAAVGPDLQRAYDALPKEFMGFPARRESAHAGRRVGVLSIPEFYRRYTGKVDANLTAPEWLRMPEHALATVTNGEIFTDPLGEFSRIRAGFLAYYPEDVRLKKIAARAAMMAQSGQANYPRCMSRGESVGARLALGEFLRHAGSMIFLLNRKYPPFYKWTHRAMRDLPLLPGAAALLEKIALPGLDEGNWKFAPPAEMVRTLNTGDPVTDAVEQLCALVAERLRAEGLSDREGDFLIPHAEAVTQKIKDGAIRSLHIMEG